MASKDKSQNEIRNLIEDWGYDERNGLPYSGQSVQNFIKGQLTDAASAAAAVRASLASKYGYLHIPMMKESDGYYHAYCFASEEDFNTWSTDHMIYSQLLLQEVVIPISTDIGKSYSARLYVSETPTSPIVSIEKKYFVHLRYCGVELESGVGTNCGVIGTLVVQRSTNNGETWLTVGNEKLSSRDTSSTAFDAVDIGKYFSDTNPQQIRVRVGYTVYDDSDNVLASPVSAWITFSNITCTTLTITPNNDITQAVKASLMYLPLGYYLTGEIARTLHVKVGDYTQTYPIGATEYTSKLNPWSGQMIDAGNTHGLFVHGVRTIEAWLTCSNGVIADAIESEHVFTQVMVDAEADEIPRIVISKFQPNVVNYVPSKLCEWAVWAPTGANISSVPVLFKLTDANGNVEFLNEQYNAVPGTVYEQNVTVEIEDRDHDTLSATFKAFANNEVQPQFTSILSVDNTEKYAPVRADWVLNPKMRNNTTARVNDVIDGANATFSGFSFTADGWIEKEDEAEIVVNDQRQKVKQKVLRIMAGESLTIEKDWLAAFSNNRSANVTLEIDFMVRNVVNEAVPIFEAKEPQGTGWKGLQMYPLEGAIMTASNVTRSYQDFRWQEDKRTHIAINILSALSSSSAEDSHPMSVCRVFVNGIINREFLFNAQAGEWRTNGSNIIIGHPSADIDIYSIRLYEKALSNSEILNNYIATIPVADEKLSFRSNNDILDAGGYVDANKCMNKKYNVLVWHGAQPTHEDAASKSGWWEVHVYEGGEESLEYSGTICQASGSLKATRQGTTANTYYYSNLQTKIKSVSDAFAKEVTNAWIACGLGTAAQAAEKKTKALASELPDSDTGTGACPSGIWVAIDNIHSDFTDYTESGAREGYAFVSDGWIDGNGKYRGAQYKSASGVPYATKLVGKINYASSMQSHLMGACRMYNDLHKEIVGTSGRMQGRVAKYEELFLFFTQKYEDGRPSGSPAFQGPITWGAGKMDDPTWGYDKKVHTDFCMLEGADNNLPLTDFRVPWDENVFATNEDKGEITGEVTGYVYGYGDTKSLNFNLDRFKSTTREFHLSPTQTAILEGPSPEVENNIKNFVNFIYKHNTRIKVYDGVYDGAASDNPFLSSESARLHEWQWWCTQGADAFCLKRYDYINAEWVDAGWESDQITLLNLHTTYPSVDTTQTPEEVNAAFIAAIAAHARANISSIIDEESLKFHYAFLQQFLAGTDNCSKNTYYTFDSVLGKWMFSQDDMDTILATDNSGFQSKPYYIDRQNPCAEGSEDSLYEGGANALFNLCESMYESDGSIRNMMKQVLTKMSALVSRNDNIPTLRNSEKQTPWGALWKYFFMTQKRIPAVAYNETARLRYEYPQSIPFTSDRGVMPISQSMGDQLQSELQYMKRRLILFASYAEWGEFSTMTGANIGLSDAADNFGVEGTTDLDNRPANLVFYGLVPHQYLYPGGRVGQNSKGMRVRCRPGVPVDFDLTGTTPISGDMACALYGTNYYRSLGNLGDISVLSTRPVMLTARRLTSFTAVPTTLDKPQFRPTKLTLNAPLLETVDIHNSSLIGGELDLSDCPRLQQVTATGCPLITEVKLPKTNRLRVVSLGRGITALALAGVPNLTMLTFEGNQYSGITTLSIDCPTWDQSRAKELVTTVLANANVNDLTLTGIDWDNLNVNVLDRMADVTSCVATGTIVISDPSASVNGMTFMHKVKFINKWGNIDDENNALHLIYTLNQLTGLTLDGRVYVLLDGKFVNDDDKYQYTFTPANQYQNSFRSFVWSLQDGASRYGSIDPNTGVLTINRAACLDAYEGTSLIVVCTALLLDDSEVSGTFEVFVYNRLPKLGDMVYADGSACDVRYADKTVVGVCCYINPNPADPTKPERICVSKKPIITAVRWGCYPNHVGTDTTPYQEAIYNIAKLPDVTSDGSQYHAYNTSNMRGGDEVDSEGFTIKTNPVVASYNNNITGNWGFVNVLQSDVDSLGDVNVDIDPKRQRRYLPNGITVGSRVPRSMLNTLQIIRHRDIILENIPVSDSQTGLQKPEPRDSNGVGISEYLNPETFVEAVSESNNLTSLLGQIIALKGANYDEVYYPAASYCYAYEPTVQSGEVLANTFKRHRWLLPSIGLLARIWWYNSQGTDPTNQYAIFANAFQAGAYTMFGLTTLFSSTEAATSGADKCAYHGNIRNITGGQEFNLTNSNKSDKVNVYAIATF